MKRLKTYMSPVIYRTPALDGEREPKALLPVCDRDKKLYWLDEMLNGGLAIPERVWNRKDRSFLLLLAGPPGTGKSTFALELCLNLAKHEQADGRTWESLYISAESPTQRIIENAKSFGWDDSLLAEFSQEDLTNSQSAGASNCVVYGSDVADKGLNNYTRPGEFFESIVADWGILSFRESPLCGPDVLVIDSLNILGSRWGGEEKTLMSIFDDMMEKIGSGNARPRLLIVILDGYSGQEPTNSWEFLADAAFRFDGQVGPEDYYQRSFQIMKVKTQSHAWGCHTFKIYQGKEKQEATFARSEESPYLEEGATFIFPSLHWHLSRSIRKDLPSKRSSNEFNPTPISELNRILATESKLQGFPAMHTTGLVGEQGAMKSHLAYHFMLAHALGTVHSSQASEEEAKNVLLISLRDDLEAARHTLSEIIDQQELAGRNGATGNDAVQNLLNADRLEILYNWPGNITPAEFFHRIFVALARPRTNTPLRNGQEQGKVDIVVLNGLDHLEAKFPLCAREKLFVPALVSLFRCYKVCSVVISAEDHTSEREVSSIRPLADTILEFSEPSKDDLSIVKLSDDIIQFSKVSAVRVPAGQIGGRWGILNRDERGMMAFASPSVSGHTSRSSSDYDDRFSGSGLQKNSTIQGSEVRGVDDNPS